MIYVVPAKDFRKKGKIWRLLNSLHVTRDASQVFATNAEEGLSEHGFQRNVVVPCLYWGAVLEALGVHWRDDFIFGLPDDRANDLEQLMCEVFKVKICERVGPGFLTAVEISDRKVEWNAEGFSWTLVFALSRSFFSLKSICPMRFQPLWKKRRTDLFGKCWLVSGGFRRRIVLLNSSCAHFP